MIFACARFVYSTSKISQNLNKGLKTKYGRKTKKKMNSFKINKSKPEQYIKIIGEKKMKSNFILI